MMMNGAQRSLRTAALALAVALCAVADSASAFRLEIRPDRTYPNVFCQIRVVAEEGADPDQLYGIEARQALTGGYWDQVIRTKAGEWWWPPPFTSFYRAVTLADPVVESVTIITSPSSSDLTAWDDVYAYWSPASMCVDMLVVSTVDMGKYELQFSVNGSDWVTTKGIMGPGTAVFSLVAPNMQTYWRIK